MLKIATWNLNRGGERSWRYLEEYARSQIGAEELHVIEMNKLLRDYTIG